MTRSVITKLVVELTGKASRELVEFIVGEVGRTRATNGAIFVQSFG